MAKSYSELKSLIEDWIKITNSGYQDITEQEKEHQSKLEWLFLVNKTMGVYMINGRPDRITMDIPINFGEEHRNAIKRLDNKEFLQFLIDIIEPLTLAGISAKLNQDKKEIKQMTLQTYVDTETLERERFYRRWDQINAFKELTIKKIQVKFGVSGENEETGTMSPSFYG